MASPPLGEACLGEPAWGRLAPAGGAYREPLSKLLLQLGLDTCHAGVSLSPRLSSADSVLAV